jgi:serine/threonine protein kinase
VTTDDLNIPDRTQPGDAPEGFDRLLRTRSHAPRAACEAPPTADLPQGALAALRLAPQPPPVPQVGDCVDGRYRLNHVVGSGGMGIVFAATHLATGREVALKWMYFSPRHRNPSEQEASFQRFVREAEAVGRIQHPNVVDVYDAGRDPRAPFLVMQRLRGETLRAHLEARGALSWEEALALFLPILAGIAEAHRCGVVHRDLKPDNVFLAEERGAIVPKLLDFGVSRLRPAEDGPQVAASLTRTGAVLGTPAYMPLEQLRASGDVDARTDIYALGVMLYEMLAGKRPYEARNAADFAVLLASQPPAPLTRWRPDLRGAREAAVMHALARKPSERPANVESLTQLLRAARPAGAVRARTLASLGCLLVLSGLAYAALHRPAAASSSRPSAQRSQQARAALLPRASAPAAPRFVQDGASSAVASPAPQPAPLAPPVRSRKPAARVPRPAADPNEKRTAPAAQGFTKLAPDDFQLRELQPRLAAPAAAARPRAPTVRPSLALGRDEF